MDIDFDNTNHINYIKKLAKRNKFYQKEIEASIEESYKTNIFRKKDGRS